MNEELKKKLLIEIERTGFSHELAVIQRLREMDVTVFPNLGFVDVDGRPHEIDVFAFVPDGLDRTEGCDVSLNLLIECKSSASRPWVFFNDPWDGMAVLGLVDRLRFNTTVTTNSPYTVLAGCMNGPLAGHHYNDKGIPVARTHFEAFGSDAGRDIYAGVTNLWYALDHIKRVFGTPEQRGRDALRVNFVHPVLVYKGVLVVAEKNGEEYDLEEVPHVLLRTTDVVTDKGTDFRVSSREIIIDVIHESYLEEYVRICGNDLQAAVKHMERFMQSDWFVRDNSETDRPW